MLWLAMHASADVGDVGEDATFVAFAMDGRRGDGVSFAAGGEERRVLSMEGGVEAGEEFGVCVVAVAAEPRL